MEALLDGDLEVGRKKTPAVEPPKPEPTSIHVRGSAEWVAWVLEWAEEDYRSAASLIEMALAEMAKSRGRKEPPRR